MLKAKVICGTFPNYVDKKADDIYSRLRKSHIIC